MTNAPMLPKKPSCPICGSERIRTRCRIGQYEIYRCGRCRVGFVSPQPNADELATLYSPAYFDSYADVGCEGLRPALEKEFERKLDLLEQRVEHRGSLLEIGCGPGYFLRAARQRGWAAQGVDVSAEVAARAREYSGAPVHAGSIQAAGLTEGTFDAVVMWATIEHLANPTRTLIEAYRMLRRGGMIQLDTGLIDDIVGRLEPGYSAWFRPPEHLFFFTRKSIRTALGFAGFVDVEITTDIWLPRWRFVIHRIAKTARQLVRIARDPRRFFSAGTARAKDGTIMYVSARRPRGRSRGGAVGAIDTRQR